jgi:hypothetical protein
VASDPRAREAAFAELVAGLIDARVDLASARFDSELAAAEASGRLDPETARLLRWWQRESVRSVTDHARSVVPVALSALERSAVEAQEAVVQADAAWTTARAINARSLYPEPDVSASMAPRPAPAAPQASTPPRPPAEPRRAPTPPPATPAPEFDEDLGPEPPATVVPPPAAPAFGAFVDADTSPFTAPAPAPPPAPQEPDELPSPPAAQEPPTPILRSTPPPPMPPPYVPPAEREQASYAPPVTASYDDPGPIVDKEDRPDAPPNDGRRRTLLAGLTVLQQDG